MIFRKNQNGLSLMEIVIALAILSILLVSFMTVFASSFVSIVNSGRKTQNMAQAQQIIENNDFSQLNKYTNLQNMLSDPFDGGTLDINGRYHINVGSITIDDLDASLSDSSYNTLTVLVFDKNQRDYVTLTTFTKLNP